MSSPVEASAKTTTGVTSLASELIRLILEHVDREDLKCLRQVNKFWRTFATEDLFRHITLVGPSEASIQRWNAMVSDDTIRQAPRHISIESQEDLHEDGYGEDQRLSNELSEGFLTAIESIAKVPNVVSLELRFSGFCEEQTQGAEDDSEDNPENDSEDDSEDESEYFEPIETIKYRNEVLLATLKAIQNRAADEGNQTIRNLIIIDLQNHPPPDFIASELFRSVLKDLDELHLQIATECFRSEEFYTRAELQTLPRQLCADWVAPIAHNLKALTLGTSHGIWALLPGHLASSALHFPNLKMLCLQHYSLAHDDQLDWVLAQKSLTTLVLQRCRIMTGCLIHAETIQRWNLTTDERQSVSIGEEYHHWPNAKFYYKGTWARFFGRIRDSLPNLVDFIFNDPAHLYNTYQLTSARAGKMRVNTDDLHSGIFPDRYLGLANPDYDRDASSDTDGDGYSYPSKTALHGKCHKRDQRALDALKKTCQKRSGGK